MTAPWLTVEDAAEWAGLTPAQVTMAGEAGRFKIIHVGSMLRIPEDEFGRSYGLKVPGPRELELEMERAEGIAKRHEKREQPPTSRDHWLYWFFDAAGRLLYIGITNSGVKRMEQHGADKVWWPEVANIRVDHFATREECEAAEAAAIKANRPAYNGTHNLEFKQQPVAPCGPSFDEMVPPL